MEKNQYPYRLMTPGPVSLHPEVLQALAQPVQHHRTDMFLKTLSRVWKGLQWFFSTQQPVLMITSTGSGAMEAAIVNTLSEGDEVLVIVSGKFGERWAEIAEIYKLKVHRINVVWGQSVDLEKVRAFLRGNAKIKAVFCQAVETSTATQHPIQELAKIIKMESSALFAVDAITGLGAMKLDMDGWQIDILVGGSQKAFMLPAGLSFIAFSERAWRAYETSNLPCFYLDMGVERLANQKGQTFFSSPSSHIVALDTVLTLFQKQGMDSLIQRCELLAKTTRVCGEILGLKVFSQSPAASVTALQVPDGMNAEKIRGALECQFNMTVMGGQEYLQGKILRIGHLGYIRDEDEICMVEFLGKLLLPTDGNNEVTTKTSSTQSLEDGKLRARNALEKAQSLLQQGPNAY
ncbi:MAG: alanine--glyoxylate aminotransferase family protein [Bdellovibrionales bacterium]|nr:alanine--glyoxylate aminotransferase family protein [Bdellovibrionales bacterium]